MVACFVFPGREENPNKKSITTVMHQGKPVAGVILNHGKDVIGVIELWGTGNTSA